MVISAAESSVLPHSHQAEDFLAKHTEKSDILFGRAFTEFLQSGDDDSLNDIRFVLNQRPSSARWVLNNILERFGYSDHSKYKFQFNELIAMIQNEFIGTKLSEAEFSSLQFVALDNIPHSSQAVMAASALPALKGYLLRTTNQFLITFKNTLR